MKAVLIGYGEVGKGIYDAFKVVHQIAIQDEDQGYHAFIDDYVLMLVAIPYNDGFIQTVKDYQFEFRPETTIIFSTVPIGTSKQLGAVHSPIEAHHTRMAEYIRESRHWVGGQNQTAITFFIMAGVRVVVLPEPDQTEFLKLRSTTVYGINIEFARYCDGVAGAIGMDPGVFEMYDRDYNELVAKMGRPEYQRYVLKPPQGKIGGHCVLPNAKILQKQYPHPFIQTVLDFNLGFGDG
jgi:hypothetical protein